MSKTETLEKLLSFAFVMSENMVGLTKGNYDEATFIKKTYAYLHKYNIDSKSKLELEKALQRLEAIDNANPSEALNCLEKLGRLDLYESYINLKVNEVDEFGIVKQALIKAQEQEEENAKLNGQMKYLGEVITDFQKMLKIVFEKNVQINNLKKCKTLEEYNILWTTDELTQEEFDTLKEWAR